MITAKIILTFTEELLGTSPGDPKVFEEFVASKSPNGTKDEEVEALPVEEEIEKSSTVFPRTEDGAAFLYDYQIKGFFKDACGCLRRVPKTASANKNITAYKKIIDGLIFVNPRQIPIDFNGGETGHCQRPLRAQTARGERIALARSETAPVGSSIVFAVEMLRDDLIVALEEWLDYGSKRGLGQWRNSGKGRFTYVME